jgi:hypothetical protein
MLVLGGGGMGGGKGGSKSSTGKVGNSCVVKLTDQLISIIGFLKLSKLKYLKKHSVYQSLFF